MTDLGFDTERLQAVIFDFDGVILESASVKDRAFLDLFAEYPEHLERIHAHHREHLGVSRFTKFEWIYEQLLRRPLSEEESQDLGRRFSSLVAEGTMSCPLVPGATELLQALVDRLPLFVASATPQDELDHIIATRGLRKFFASVHGWPPDKANVMREILSEGSFQPERVLMIGDAMTDLDAAREVGCRFLARIEDSAPGQPFPKDLPRVRTLHELVGMLC